MKLLHSVLAMCLLTFAVNAQQLPNRFNGTASSATAGQALNVHFSDASKANQDVDITVFDIMDDKKTTTLTISLDSGGHGVGPFVVPQGWIVVVLQNDSSADFTVPVE